MRSTGEFRSFKLVRALENIHLGEFFSSKLKALLVNTLRGVPFNQCEQSEPSRTRIGGVQFLSEIIILSLISSYKAKHLNSSKFYYLVV